MPTVYDSLQIEFNRCPPDCRLCEEACAKEKGDGVINLSRVKPVHAPQVSFHGAITCVQCSQPRCRLVCPVGAIDKSQADGIVRIDESKCVGCGLCTLACSYGGIYYNGTTKKAFKCDRCDEHPKCVAACPYQVINSIHSRAVLSYLATEDSVSPGISACIGCLAELALRFTLRVLGKNTIIFGAPGCVVAWLHGFGAKGGTRLAHCYTLLTNVASTMTGVSRYYRRMGRDVNVVAFVGDGATVDAGFQPLSAAAERGENLIYICDDNEGYMNTGVQRSGSTPFGAQTTTTPVGKVRCGKEQDSKYLPLLMLFHGIPYVATATIAYPEDYAHKLTKAMKVKNGLSYIHLFLPCPTGWGFPENQGIDVCRLAVETNYFPLWEAENGKVRLTKEIACPKPIAEYTGLIGRYSHLTVQDMEKVERLAKARYDLIRTLAASL